MFSASKTGAGAGGYLISNSLRFQSASSQYLNRTPSSAGNRKTWTWSAWVKKAPIQGTATSTLSLFSCTTGNTDSTFLRFGFFQDKFYVGNWNAFFLQSTPVYRDPSAWYHVVVSTDTTQGTASNRMRVYINGTEITAWSTDQRSTYLTSSVDLGINQATQHSVGSSLPNVGEYFDGYMTDINFVNAQQLTPSSFGETDATTGQWIAKKYTGTYGTNGFYLPFSNGTSTTTLGADSSGNGNNWTLNNFTRSAGTSDCWMIDVPSGNGGASGTQPSSNYCVLNPLQKETNTTVQAANLTVVCPTSGFGQVRGSIGMTSGKWYWEFTCQSANNNDVAGLAKENASFSTFLGNDANGWAYYGFDGKKINNATQTIYGAAYTNNDVIGVAFDADVGSLTFYKNNVSQGVAFTGLTSGPYFPAHGDASSGAATQAAYNFGQRSFAYTPPTGFKALCTANLPAATIKQGNQYMDATTYTGNGTARSITNSGSMQPDLVWIKSRSNTWSHMLQDAVRGSVYSLSSNSTGAEIDQTGFGVSSFNSNGFSLATGGSFNNNNDTYVAWQWDAGSSTVTNTNGTISSQVRANPTAGVSIATFTAGSGDYTVGHGLGVAPSMTIVKRRDSATGGNWWTWHIGLGNNTTDYLALNLTDAEGSAANMWGSVGRNSTVSGFNGTASTVAGGTFVMYNFSEIAGFSKFGSYTGNGSADGPFVYLGFRPKFVMIKMSSSTESWVIEDTSRDPYNLTVNKLYANSSSAEDSGNTYGTMDIVSNGFKLRASHPIQNSSGQTYIYMAFAENPFAQANAR
jgi:hypothetical protein